MSSEASTAPISALEDTSLAGLTPEQQAAAQPHLTRLDPDDNPGAYRAGVRLGITAAALAAWQSLESPEKRAEREALEQAWVGIATAGSARHASCKTPCGRGCEAHFNCADRCGPGCLKIDDSVTPYRRAAYMAQTGDFEVCEIGSTLDKAALAMRLCFVAGRRLRSWRASIQRGMLRRDALTSCRLRGLLRAARSRPAPPPTALALVAGPAATPLAPRSHLPAVPLPVLVLVPGVRACGAARRMGAATAA